MSITVMANPGGCIDVEFYNAGATTIRLGEIASGYPDVVGTMNFPVDQQYTGTRGALEGLNVSIAQYAVKLADTLGGPFAGIALHDVAAGEWGKFRVRGPGKVRLATAGTVAAMAGLGASATGQAVANANFGCYALQSVTTTANGELIGVMVQCMEGGATDESPHGAVS